LIANGSIQEMILVVADGVNTLGGSFYVNSPVTGNWEDFIAKDLVSYVDANYRTLPNAASRGISGHSMGGFGALNVAMKHPEVFGTVYSLSPGLFDPQGLSRSQLFASSSMIDVFFRIQDKESTMSIEEGVEDMKSYRFAFDTLFMLAYGTAFAPDPKVRPPYIDYPYKRQGATQALDQTIWGKWENGFGGIPKKIQLYKDNFLRLNGIVVDYGQYDEFRWIPKGCEYFSSQLSAAGIPNQLVSFPGGHQSNLPERIRKFMLPYFSGKLVFEN
jgi:pimeloyl-ACP methyl ester carboxylesterase